jgi:zinc protease
VRSVPLAHAALAFASLLVLIPLGGCRSLGGVGTPSRPAADPLVAAGAMGGPRTRAESRLDNGVRVVVEENHAAPLVALEVWLAVGAGDDPPALAGSAHLFEHLVFRGTRRRAPGAAEREIAAVGGTIGAWTGLDETVYHATVAPPFLDVGLDVLADALTAPAFDPAELAQEKQVVAAELARQAVEPARAATEMLRAVAFAGERAGRPLLGTPETVAGATREALAARFAESYAGENMTVVVVGDVNAAAARAAVARAFARVPRGHAARAPEAPGSASAPRVLVSTAAGPEAEVAVGFRVSAPRAEDAAALDLLAALLAGGREARVPRELCDNRQVATAVRGLTFYARGGSSRGAALLALLVAPAPQRIEAAAQAAIEEALRLGREEVPSDELARARAALESDVGRGGDGVEGRARRLGFAAAIADDAGYDARYRDSLAAIDPPALRETAARFLSPGALRLAVLDPGGARGRSAEAEAARFEALVTSAARPADGRVAAAPAQVGGDVVRAITSSGLRILVLRDRGAPMVAVEAAWAGGARVEDAGSNGAGALIAALLDRGTRTRSAAQIGAEVGALGGRLGGFSDRSHLGLRAELLPGGWARGLALLADCLLRPSFPAGEVDGARRVVVDRARAADGDPARGAWRLFREALWPGHPYRLDPLGSAGSLAALGRVRLLEHYRRHYPVSRLVVSVVGDVDPKEVVATLTALFAAAAPGAPPPDAAPDPVHAAPAALFRPTARDVAEIVLGYPGPPGPPARDPDRLALEVLAEALAVSGGPLDRALGRTSGVFSFAPWAAGGVDPGELAVAVSCAPAAVDAVVAALRGALAGVAAAGLGADEIAAAARRLAGARALDLRGASAIADALALDEAYGSPLMSYRHLPAALAAITAADVNRAARRFLDPQRETIAVVRPEAAPAKPTAPPTARQTPMAARAAKGAP